MENKRNTWKYIAAAVGVGAAVIFCSGLLGGKDLMYHMENRGDLGPLTRDDITYLDGR